MTSWSEWGAGQPAGEALHPCFTMIFGRSPLRAWKTIDPFDPVPDETGAATTFMAPGQWLPRAELSPEEPSGRERHDPERDRLLPVHGAQHSPVRQSRNPELKRGPL